MGKPSGGATDQATQVYTGSFTATGQSAGALIRGKFNLAIWGTFTASVALERTFDGGTTWLNCSLDAAGSPNALTVPVALICEEPEPGVLYRLNCSSYTSGTVNWRISQ